jgi:hypothetical protein
VPKNFLVIQKQYGWNEIWVLTGFTIINELLWSLPLYEDEAAFRPHIKMPKSA